MEHLLDCSRPQGAGPHGESEQLDKMEERNITRMYQLQAIIEHAQGARKAAAAAPPAAAAGSMGTRSGALLNSLGCRLAVERGAVHVKEAPKLSSQSSNSCSKTLGEPGK